MGKNLKTAVVRMIAFREATGSFLKILRSLLITCPIEFVDKKHGSASNH